MSDQTDRATAEASLLDQMAELERALEEAIKNENARRRVMRDRTAELTDLRTRRLAYEVAVGAGERDPDEEFEAGCDRALGAHGVEEQKMTPWGEAPYVEVRDRRAKGRLDGATRAREQALGQLRQFTHDHIAPLTDELVEGTEAEEQAVIDALDALAAALRPVTRRDAALRKTYTLAGMTADAPDEPFEDLRHVVAKTLANGR